MKLSDIKVNSNAIEHGRWVSVAHMLPDVRLKVRGHDNADYQALLSKITAETPRSERVAPPPDKVRLKTARLIVETILLDWAGIENDDGTPMAFSKEKAFDMLSNPDYSKLVKAIDWASSVVGEDDIGVVEDASKN